MMPFWLIRSKLFCIALLFGPMALAAQQPDSAPPPRSIAELETRIRAALERHKVPAVGIAIVSRDSVLWTAGLGLRDVAGGKAADANTLFRMAPRQGIHRHDGLMPAGLQTIEDRSASMPRRSARTDGSNRSVRIINTLEHATVQDDRPPRLCQQRPETLTSGGLDFNPQRGYRWRRHPGGYCARPAGGASSWKLEVATRDLVSARLLTPIMSHATASAEVMASPPSPRGRQDAVPYWRHPAAPADQPPRTLAAYVRFLLNRGAVSGTQRRAAEIERWSGGQPHRQAGLPVGYRMHLATSWTDASGSATMARRGGLTMMAYRERDRFLS
jgi:hypothetical protein